MEPKSANNFNKLDDPSFIRYAYLRFLGRLPDLEGFVYFLRQLKTGRSREVVIQELVDSPEGRLTSRRGFTLGIRTKLGSNKPEGAEFLNGETAVVLPVEEASSPKSEPLHAAPGIENFATLMFDSRESGVAGSFDSGEVLKDFSSIKNVNQLFAFHGVTFIRAAYLLILGREPDQLGARSHYDLLCQGYSRSYVIKSLATSAEGAGNPKGVIGLDELLRGYRMAQPGSWSGWYWREVKGYESDAIRDRAGRVVVKSCFGR